MEQKFLQLATVFENLAAIYRSMASTDQKAPKKEAKAETVTDEKPKEVKPITIEEVRALLSAKMEAGKRKEVKALLMKYDSGKLSGVKPEDYAALMAEAEVL